MNSVPFIMGYITYLPACLPTLPTYLNKKNCAHLVSGYNYNVIWNKLKEIKLYYICNLY